LICHSGVLLGAKRALIEKAIFSKMSAKLEGAHYTYVGMTGIWLETKNW
jgi:hypothetical protein